jgi:hypothetical protein
MIVCAVLGVVISHGGWAIASTEVVIACFLLLRYR